MVPGLSLEEPLPAQEATMMLSSVCTHTGGGQTCLEQGGERLFRAHSHCDIMKGGTQGFPRHEVSDKQEVLFEDVSPSTAFL